MPSPFPGMDPFLEHPDFFPDLHGALHVYIREALQLSLPEPYFAVINERLWVETAARYIEPDSDILHRDQVGQPPRNSGSTTAVAVAAESMAKPVPFEIMDDERSESFVEIRTRRDDSGERIVTTIEVLSPSNKQPGEKGRELYLKKQNEILESPIHLVEIDLLRGGRHTTPVPRPKITSKIGPFDYHVSLRRFDQPTVVFVYAWRLRDKMPEIAIPLLPGDGDVPLDLQAVFTRCYDTGPYSRRIQYDPDQIVPKLDEEQTVWVRQVLSTGKTDSKHAEG